jgi:hypothetical protein
MIVTCRKVCVDNKYVSGCLAGQSRVTTKHCPKPVVVLILCCEVIPCKSRSMNNSVTHVAATSRLHTAYHHISWADNTRFSYHVSWVSSHVKIVRFFCLYAEMSLFRFYSLIFDIEIGFPHRVHAKRFYVLSPSVEFVLKNSQFCFWSLTWSVTKSIKKLNRTLL